MPSTLYSLPTELLRLIFSSTREGTIYYNDQFTLGSLALTCRHFRPIAQELIFKNVEVYGDEDLNRALDWLERREGSIVIDNFLLGYVERETGALERIIRICPDLQVFAIYVDSEEPFDLSIVSNLRQLHTLSIREGEAITFRPTPFLALKTLHLSINSITHAELLSPTFFPSLTCLRLHTCFTFRPEGPETTSLRQLLPQLRLLEIDKWLFRNMPVSLLAPFMPRVLVQIPLPDTPILRPVEDVVHIQFTGLTWREREEEVDKESARLRLDYYWMSLQLLRFGSEILEGRWPRLRSLHLERWLGRGFSVKSKDLNMFLQQAEVLRLTCEERGICVIYRDEENREADPLVSQWLLDYEEPQDTEGQDLQLGR